MVSSMYGYATAFLALAAATSAAPSSPLAASSSGSAAVSNTTGPKYLITFGDSYSQTGFDPTSTKPSAANPLGNPAMPGWTASGGLNWVGVLASELNRTVTLAYNFAYGGATTDADLVVPYDPAVLSFIDQVGQFNDSLAGHPAYAPWTAADAVAGVWIGVNDVGNSYYLADEDARLERIMARYFEQVGALYAAGVRSFFFLTVPPIDKTPLMLEQSADARALEVAVIDGYNARLAAAAADFAAARGDAVVHVVDTAAPFNEAIGDPTAYGAPDATCENADGTSCLWFNNYHPGVEINRLVARAVVDELGSAWS